MYNWRAVPLPERMQKLDRDKRGLPIPFIILRDNEGTPHFTINDDRQVMRCLAEDRCAICGQKLLRGRWFVGGPLSAFHPQGAYFDTPLHHECMRYAVQVCPYLAAPKYAGRLDAATLDPAKLDGRAILVDQTMVPGRPTLFVAVLATGHKVFDNGHLQPKRPYLDVEFWQHSVQLSDEVGQRLTNEALLEGFPIVITTVPKILTPKP